MLNSLKQLREKLETIKSLQKKHEALETELIRFGSQTLYKKTKKFYSDCVSKLLAEMKSLPIGYRYLGTFYVRKPYTTPVNFEKIEGSAFMREDLVSWQIEDSEKHKYSYYREIFEKPDLNSIITKSQAKTVYINVENAENAII